MKKSILSFFQLFICSLAICQNPVMVKDIFPGFAGSSIQQIVRSTNYTFFNAEDEDADTDRGLYRTDGTEAGTIKLNLVYPGYLSSKADKLTVSGNKVVFAANNSNSYGEVWVSDGSQAGTMPLDKAVPTIFSTNPSSTVVTEIAQLGNSIIYGIRATDNRNLLKITDGTVSGTTIVKDFGTLANEDATMVLFKAINGILYFTLFDGNSDQLWRSDGTAAGTFILQDFGTDQYMASPYMPAGAFFYWMIVKPDTGNVLWKSDGTVGGTAPLKTIGTTGNNNYPANVALGDTLFFAGLDGNGKELWKTDGTVAGTVLVADINTGAASSNPVGLTLLDSSVYFSAFTAATGNELWKYHMGIVSLVKDIYPGTANGNPSGLSASNGVILFSAIADATGSQLWVTDGSATNTLRAAEINPYGAAAPAAINAGNPVYFTADDGINGRELFAYDNSNGISAFLLKAGAIDLDGQNDFAQGSNADLPQGNAARTMEAWINPGNTQNGTIFNYGTTATNQRAGLHYINQKLFFVGQGNDLQGNTIIPGGTWTHVAVTFANNVVRLYVNGVLDGAGSKVLATSGSDFRIGTSIGSPNEFFTGKVDEVRIWNRSLTACEIVNDMRCELRGTEDGLVGYYNFNQGDARRTNTEENILFENSNNSKNAQFFNLAFTGFKSNWVYPGALLNDVVCNQMNVFIYSTVKNNYICQGDTASFIAKPTRRGANVSYQWIKNGVNIPNATDSVYSLLSLGVSDSIRCKMTQVTNCGTFIFTSNVEILHGIYASYTFTGNGDWEVSTNWANNAIPPKILPSCSEIIINPIVGGQCTLNEFQVVDDGAKFMVLTGAKLNIISNLVISDSSYFDVTDTAEYSTGLSLLTASELSQFGILQASDTTFMERRQSGDMGRTTPPASFYLDMPTPGNQQLIAPYNSCAAWAMGYGMMGYYTKVQEKNKNYDGEDKRISPSFIWNQLNKQDFEQGLKYSQVIDLIKTMGMCKWPDMEGNVNYLENPSEDALENARDYIDETLQFRLLPVVDIQDMKAKIADGHPLAFGAFVGDAFKYPSRKNFVEKPDGRIVYIKRPLFEFNIGLLTGSHAMVICGYDDAINAFKVMNSWGTVWGNKGFIWIDYDVFKDMVNYLRNEVVDGIHYRSAPYIVMALKTYPAISMSISVAPTCEYLENKVVVNYNIISLDGDPILERGICYSKEINPTTSTIYPYNISRKRSGGTGNFTDTMINLEYNKKYYVRSFVKTKKGISYSNDDSVTVYRALETSFTDVRDGQTYGMRRIGNQIWMTENLNYNVPGSLTYNNDPASANTYGRLYTWQYAQSVAPPGWHLPSLEEYMTLVNCLGGDLVAGGKLKDTSALWEAPNVAATNSSGFKGLPGGVYYLNGSFQFGFLGRNADFWTTTEHNWQGTFFSAYGLSLRSWSYGTGNNVWDKQNYLSVRCIKD